MHEPSLRDTSRRLTKLGVCAPTLVLDRQRVLRNIDRMEARARAAGARFRPHFKTHQSLEIGGWFRERGIEQITVSSLSMAQAFARDGWRDITIAFLVNILQLEQMDALAQKVGLELLVDSPQHVTALHDGLRHSTAVWIKIDTGYGRTGIRWDEPAAVVSLTEQITRSSRMQFAGLLTHSGNTYHAPDIAGVRAIHRASVMRLQGLQDRLRREGLPQAAISIGDTPSCSVVTDLTGVDEIRPGNFAFYDLMQWRQGTCQGTELAVAVACPVVGKYKQRRQIAIHGGAVHFGQDFLPEPDGQRVFGYLTALEGGSLGQPDPRARLTSLSQEHGIVQVAGPLWDQLNVGDVVLIFPVHACLTCNLHRQYRALDGGDVARI